MPPESVFLDGFWHVIAGPGPTQYELGVIVAFFVLVVLAMALFARLALLFEDTRSGRKDRKALRNFRRIDRQRPTDAG